MPGHPMALRRGFLLSDKGARVSLQEGREREGVSCVLLSPVILRAKDRVT